MSASSSTLALAIVAACIACSAERTTSTPDAPPPPPPPPPPTTSITVNVIMAGNSADSDGFAVNVAGQSLAFTGAASQTITGVSPGAYTAQLSGLAGNCASDSLAVPVAASLGAVASVSFTVECYGGFAYSAASLSGKNPSVYYIDELGHTSVVLDASNAAFVRSWSADGKTALIQKYKSADSSEIWVAARDGTFSRELPAGPNTAPQFSPDGSRILYTQVLGLAQLRLTDIPGTFDRALFTDSTSHINGFASWSPDGTRIAFITDRYSPPPGILQIAIARADGTAGIAVTPSLSFAGVTQWSADGQFVAAELDTVVGAPKPFIALIPVNGGQMVDPAPNQFLRYTLSDFSWGPSTRGPAMITQQQDTSPLSVVLANRNGSPPVVLAPALANTDTPSWSKDGARILIAAPGPAGSLWIYVVRPNGTHLHPVVQGSIAAYGPSWNVTATPGARDGAATSRRQRRSR